MRAKAHGSVLSQCKREVCIPKDLKWTIILLCTEGDSLMYHFNPFPDHCRVIHITEQIDFTSESGYQYVLDIVGRTGNVMMLVSFLCIGGWPFQRWNQLQKTRKSSNVEETDSTVQQIVEAVCEAVCRS